MILETGGVEVRETFRGFRDMLPGEMFEFLGLENAISCIFGVGLSNSLKE